MTAVRVNVLRDSDEVGHASCGHVSNVVQSACVSAELGDPTLVACSLKALGRRAAWPALVLILTYAGTGIAVASVT